MTTTPSADLWTAQQCADHRGVDVHDWLNGVYAGREPWFTTGEGEQGFWDPHTVRTWRHHAELDAGEWLSQKCAWHFGISAAEWNVLVRDGGAPQPTRRVKNRYLVWNADEVRSYTPPAPKEKPSPALLAPGARPGEWNDRQCAAFLGITPGTWKDAVRRDLAPAPVRKQFWAERVVRAGAYPLARKMMTSTEAAAACRVTVHAWNIAVSAGRAPSPAAKDGSTRLWDLRAVQDIADSGTWTAWQCAREHGVSVEQWRQASESGQAPAAIGQAGDGAPYWDAAQVRLIPRLSEKEKPFVCDCGRWFRTGSALSSHQRTHTKAS